VLRETPVAPVGRLRAVRRSEIRGDSHADAANPRSRFREDKLLVVAAPKTIAMRW
jgi:hypothetical protein